MKAIIIFTEQKAPAESRMSRSKPLSPALQPDRKYHWGGGCFQLPNRPKKPRLCCLHWEMIVHRAPAHCSSASPSFPTWPGLVLPAQSDNLLCSCRVNGPTALSRCCLEGTAAPKWIAMIFNTDRRANHCKPMLAVNWPHALMWPDSYLGPPSSWRPPDSVQGDKSGREQIESEKVVDFLQVLRWGEGSSGAYWLCCKTGQWSVADG